MAPIYADFNALRLKVIEIPQSALQLIITGPCEISLDPDMPGSHPTQSVMLVPLLVLPKIILVESLIKVDFEVSNVDLGVHESRYVIIGHGSHITSH